MSNEISLRPKYFATVSGGKDSLFMLKLILDNLDKYPLDGVVHYELEIDFPFIQNVIDLMESDCKRYGIPFYRIKPRKTFSELQLKYGMPSRIHRWCNNVYKLDCYKQLKSYLSTIGFYPVVYIGYCFDETKRYQKRDPLALHEIYPLVDFKIYEDDILSWAKDVSQFNDYYKYNRRCGCMFCPMQGVTTMAYFYKFYPSLFLKWIRMCADTEEEFTSKRGKPFSLFQTNPKYNAKYYENLIIQNYNDILLSKYQDISFNFLPL